MMKLSLMKTFFETVSEDWESPIGQEIAKRWVDSGSIAKCWRASANFVFRIHTKQEEYFLRFNHESERTVKEFSAECEFLTHLIKGGIHLAKPVSSKAHHYVESCSTALGIFHAVLFEALPGEHRESDTLSYADYEVWGETLGDVHALSEGYKGGHRASWHDHLQFAQHMIPNTEEAAWRELETVACYLKQLPITKNNFGMIHYDFELDNLKWSDGKVGILDFDDCSLYWYVADIAYALRALFNDSLMKVDLRNETFQAFLRGYRAKKWIADEDLQYIPLFVRFHNLVTFAKILRSLEKGKVPNEPECTTNIRTKLTHWLDQRREDFTQYPYSKKAYTLS